MVDWVDDDRLMSELKRAVAASDAVPERARTAARAAFAWRTIDEELMMISHDSAVSADVLVRGVGVAEPRVVSFQGSGFSLEVELDGGSLMGQVLPGRAAKVTVASPAGLTLELESDDAGFFSATGLEESPLRFTVEIDGDTQTTEWLVL